MYDTNTSNLIHTKSQKTYPALRSKIIFKKNNISTIGIHIFSYRIGYNGFILLIS